MEGSAHEQMMPKLENKMFLVKYTQCMRLERHKKPYNTVLETRKRGMQQLA
jgi:hypothetical protein